MNRKTQASRNITTARIKEAFAALTDFNSILKIQEKKADPDNTHCSSRVTHTNYPLIPASLADPTALETVELMFVVCVNYHFPLVLPVYLLS